VLSDDDDKMSVLLSISSILSLLTFLTTVLALVRVGTAAFASNQPFRQQAPHIGVQPLRIQWAGGEEGMSLSRALRLGFKAEREEKQRANGAGLENGYLAGAPQVRMSSMGMLSSSARALGRPPSPYPRLNVPAPISMAKLIISRQNRRKPGRVSVRRPPGLPTNTTPSSRSRLIEQVL